jgi:hypothetical protein
MRYSCQRTKSASFHASVIVWITIFGAAALIQPGLSKYTWAESPIIVGPANIECGSSGDFSVLNSRTGRSYGWQLSGPGSLEAGSGRRARFDGPSPDECCSGGPATITVTDSEGQTEDIELGFYPPETAERRYVMEALPNFLPDCAHPKCGWAIIIYNCDGSIEQGPDFNGGCCLFQIHCYPDDWCLHDCDDGCIWLEDFYEENYPYYFDSACCPNLSSSPSTSPPPADTGFGGSRSPGCGDGDPCCNGGADGAGAPGAGGPAGSGGPGGPAAPSGAGPGASGAPGVGGPGGPAAPGVGGPGPAGPDRRRDFGGPAGPDGPGRDPGFVGNPISVYNGNKFEYQNDVRIPSPNVYQLPFARFYNSQSDENGPMGFGWSHSYTVSLTQFFFWGSFLRILDHTGRGMYFEETVPGRWAGKYDEESFIPNYAAH